MTKEEAYRLAMRACEETWNDKTCKQIRETLEQQPCEDAVSKQAVNDLVDELARAISDERCYMSRGRATGVIMSDIINLPSVTPKEKTGHWIIYDERNKICSECNFKIDTWHDTDIGRKRLNYCPHCGAKMIEPQESEEI